MPGLIVEIVRFTDVWQPGWVECQFTDLGGRLYTFEEKVPLVTAEYLDAESAYPRPGLVDCKVLSRSEGLVRIEVDPIGDRFECDVAASAIVEDGAGS